MTLTTLTQLSDIADALLEKAGYFESFSCKMREECEKYYKHLKCSENFCQLLTDIQHDKVPDTLWNELEVFNFIKNEKGVHLVCPRSIQKSKIIKRCENKNCHFYSTTMAFHCILLHSRAFFPDEDIPSRVKEVGTGLSTKKIEMYKEVSVYLMRIYLILFKYGIENLKMEYRLNEFQTKYIYKFLDCVDGGIDTCPKCGAVVSKTKKTLIQIKNTDEKYEYYQDNCSCSDPEIFRKRIEVIKMWRKYLENTDYSEKILSSSYRRFNQVLDDNISKKYLMRFLLSTFNFDGLYIKHLPIGYVIRAYKILFGKLVPANFGLTQKSINMFVNLFDEEQDA